MTGRGGGHRQLDRPTTADLPAELIQGYTERTGRRMLRAWDAGKLVPL
ncbi:hypothetical protein PUR59_11790 [Streptomyces sp. SP18ES09]|nr:hypothetical protein [Streptomyces sp. SP18ES09]MEE1815688.1 hypothetical protein [Streptomyces sp. SP18ES09]